MDVTSQSRPINDTEKSILFAMLVVICIFLIYYFYKEKNNKDSLQSKYTTKEIDGIPYKVLQPNSAQILDKLNEFVYNIIYQMKVEVKAGQNFGAMTYFVNNLIRKYNPTRLLEGPFITANVTDSTNVDTAYVINKGEKLVICLRDGKGVPHSLNLLKFVTLHEITHIASIEEQHEKEFWENFKWLLMYTSKRGLYSPVDYVKNPVKYCGVLMVDSNPMFDKGIKIKEIVPDFH